MERKWKQLSKSLGVIIGGYINRLKCAENAMVDLVYAYHIEFPEDNIFCALYPNEPTRKYMLAFMREEEEEDKDEEYEDKDEDDRTEHMHQFTCLHRRDPQYFTMYGNRQNGKTTYTWKWNFEREDQFRFDHFVFDWTNILKEKYENPDNREKIDNILEQYNKTKRKTIAELNMYVRDARECGGR
jgi:hypothetical protein